MSLVALAAGYLTRLDLVVLELQFNLVSGVAHLASHWQGGRNESAPYTEFSTRRIVISWEKQKPLLKQGLGTIQLI
jgi:hypothetical protein